jgi:hypothetical protein
MTIPQFVSAKDLGFVLGIHERSVRKLTTQGILKRTKEGYDLRLSVADYIEFKETAAGAANGRGPLGEVQVEIARERLEQLRVRRKELQEQFISEVKEMFAPHIVRISKTMMSLPVRLAPHLTGIKTPAEVQKLLEVPIRNALTELQEHFQQEKTYQ